MPNSFFKHDGYSVSDWKILSEAHLLASKSLDRDPKNHQHSDRLARAVMDLYSRNIKDVGVLSTLAANRERSLEAKAYKETRGFRRMAGTD